MNLFKVSNYIEQEPDESGKIMRHRTFSIISNVQFYITLIVVMLLFLGNFAFTVVPSYSMFPTMNKGTLCFCSSHIDNPKRGDIISFFANGVKASEKSGVAGAIENIKSVTQGNKLYIKRVIGLPGDTVAVISGRLYLNGEMQDEPYLFEELMARDFSSITLGENEYFMMGDNRNNSNDSRYIGPVHRDSFFVRVLLVLPSIFDKTENPNI